MVRSIFLKKKWLLLIFIIIFVLGFGVMVLKENRVKLDFVEEGEIIFRYEDAHINHHLSNQELIFIKTLFEGKRMYKDSPSCGFSEDVSVQFNQSQTFCIARDTCPIIYWKNKDQYFKLTEEEKLQLYHLLESYGFFFPCV